MKDNRGQLRKRFVGLVPLLALFLTYSVLVEGIDAVAEVSNKDTGEKEAPEDLWVEPIQGYPKGIPADTPAEELARIKEEVDLQKSLLPGNAGLLTAVGTFLDAFHAKRPRLEEVQFPVYFEDNQNGTPSFVLSDASDFKAYVDGIVELAKQRERSPSNGHRSKVYKYVGMKVIDLPIPKDGEPYLETLFDKKFKEEDLRPLKGREGQLAAVLLTSKAYDLRRAREYDGFESMLFLVQDKDNTWKVIFYDRSF